MSFEKMKAFTHGDDANTGTGPFRLLMKPFTVVFNIELNHPRLNPNPDRRTGGVRMLGYIA